MKRNGRGMGVLESGESVARGLPTWGTETWIVLGNARRTVSGQIADRWARARGGQLQQTEANSPPEKLLLSDYETDS